MVHPSQRSTATAPTLPLHATTSLPYTRTNGTSPLQPSRDITRYATSHHRTMSSDEVLQKLACSPTPCLLTTPCYKEH
ncbi:hypothetical protein Pcinc_017370 [Petrolisthes cinctipes]|uniref:Uncharacterized protein n=1 Tax=Petrolisthes cinctipes TaxID=88211 RepID=A0AAE1FUB2_PETCI|nr:hypothetical protein Pcinc_017370 [Petrolisthes cinctipes]